MNSPIIAPFWCALPKTNSAKLDGASYDTAEDAIAAAEKRTDPQIIVLGSRRVFGIMAPACVKVIEHSDVAEHPEDPMPPVRVLP